MQWRLVWLVVAGIGAVVTMWLFGFRKPAAQPSQAADADPLLRLRLRQRVVTLRGQIDDQQAKVMIAQLLFLQDEDRRQPITLVINSPGGSVAAGMAIVDTMKDLSPPVRTRCEGSAEGMAAVILACGQRGERVVVRGSSVSLTPLTVGARASGTDLERARYLERTQHLLAGIVAERANREAKSVAEDLASGRSFDAAAAVVYGLADRVVE